jgi:hypothetical protein
LFRQAGLETGNAIYISMFLPIIKRDSESVPAKNISPERGKYLPAGRLV